MHDKQRAWRASFHVYATCPDQQSAGLQALQILPTLLTGKTHVRRQPNGILHSSVQAKQKRFEGRGQRDTSAHRRSLLQQTPPSGDMWAMPEENGPAQAAPGEAAMQDNVSAAGQASSEAHHASSRKERILKGGGGGGGRASQPFLPHRSHSHIALPQLRRCQISRLVN